jgi:putative transposase
MNKTSMWPHAPWHDLSESGIYFVTAATQQHETFFRGRKRLDFLQDTLFDLVDRYRWDLHVWNLFPNHYHLVAASPQDGAESLRSMLRQFHVESAGWVNAEDGVVGRRPIWYQFRETRLTYEKSYLARLKYVNENAVHHGVARRAENYPWSSASWFVNTAPASFVKTVNSFKIDNLSVKDDIVVPRSSFD